jgi:hypothetical protein
MRPIRALCLTVELVAVTNFREAAHDHLCRQTIFAFGCMIERLLQIEFSKGALLPGIGTDCSTRCIRPLYGRGGMTNIRAASGRVNIILRGHTEFVRPRIERSSGRQRHRFEGQALRQVEQKNSKGIDVVVDQRCECPKIVGC